ncbi:MAG: tol-pal system-associated acyl-CoA thioesterase [Pseudomonadota bacterium]
MTPHRFACKIYYEDTDLQGIVYYANYLKFIERARTDALTANGIDQSVLLEEAGLMFVVRRVEADYLSPARFGDILEITTETAQVGAASLVMLQNVTRDSNRLFHAKVSVAVVSRNGRPSRMPAALREVLSGGSKGSGATSVPV